MDGTGKVSFIDLCFKYQTSLKSSNHKESNNLAYVCVVNDRNLNLTPLRKFVMPPPMFEKQIALSHFPIHLDMQGHLIVALLSNSEMMVADCMDHENPKMFPFQLASLDRVSYISIIK